nr:ATP-dependent RecD-like DNA helicase [Actinomycetota bacterium]
LATAAGPRVVSTAQLDAVETWWAMTIHKSQGSEFPHVVVSLPAATSPILSRELLYTAVTRASERVTVVASRAALVAAIGRPVMRASGLRERLQA